MYQVRQVLPHEYPKYRSHLKKLDDSSKYLRFGYAIQDTLIDSLCDKIEDSKENHILFCIEDDNLEFIGVGHVATVSNEMELAFSVLKLYQGQGIGTELMKHCIRWCISKNILQGTMICLQSNSAITHLCDKFGMIMKNDRGEVSANIDLKNVKIDDDEPKKFAIANWLTKRVSKAVNSAKLKTHTHKRKYHDKFIHTTNARCC